MGVNFSHKIGRRKKKRIRKLPVRQKPKKKKAYTATAPAATAAAAASGFGLQWLLSQTNSFPANQESAYERAYCWTRSSPLRMGRITAASTSTNKRHDQ